MNSSPLPIEVAPPTPPATPVVRGIPTNLVNRFWPFAVPYVKRALDNMPGKVAIEDIHKRVQAQQIQLWLACNGTRVVGAATTEIIQFTQARILRVLTLGGNNFPTWAPDLALRLEEWALTHDCNSIEIYTRKGFEPALRLAGYAHKMSMVFKTVKPRT